MADTKTSAETAATALDGTELVRVVQGGSSKKTTAVELGLQFRGARVKRTSDQTTANFTTATEITWQSAVVDTDSFWSAGAPTRLTIPSTHNGRKANLQASVRIDLSTADTWKQLQVQLFNSSNTLQYAACNTIEAGVATTFLTVSLIGVPVATGDYVVAKLQEESDTSITLSSTAHTGMAIQIIG